MTLLPKQQAVSLSMICLYLMFSVRRVWMFRCYLVTWSLEFGIFIIFMLLEVDDSTSVNSACYVIKESVGARLKREFVLG